MRSKGTLPCLLAFVSLLSACQTTGWTEPREGDPFKDKRPKHGGEVVFGEALTGKCWENRFKAPAPDNFKFGACVPKGYCTDGQITRGELRLGDQAVIWDACLNLTFAQGKCSDCSKACPKGMGCIPRMADPNAKQPAFECKPGMPPEGLECKAGQEYCQCAFKASAETPMVSCGCGCAKPKGK